MENAVKISILLEIYGKLLTEKQFVLLDDYYNKDLSLSEIAENQKITRQAVRDNLKKGENKLFEYEEKLELMKKFEMQKSELEIILSEIKKVENCSNGDNSKKLKLIEQKLEKFSLI
ncbi:MAG: putative DNA-binding protein [Clostridia bacterium]|nr:putative DNA-binding protein [Clostridia bacterium]